MKLFSNKKEAEVCGFFDVRKIIDILINKGLLFPAIKLYIEHKQRKDFLGKKYRKS